MVQIGGGKRVLMMGSEGIVLYGPSGSSGVERQIALSWDLPNFDQQLVKALKERGQGKSVVVLFDGADQTYRKEDNIPKLGAMDRSRFVRRKLELAFPNYPIRASLEIKPLKIKGKRNTTLPSYLFVAIPDTDQVDRVGDALLESGAPVAGCGLLPAESAGLVSEVAKRAFAHEPGKESRWCVLIGQHETGGLRQIVVKDGNLALTRLTPPTEAGISGPGWTEEVTREFRATLTYISRLGYAPDDGLDVVVICDNIERQFFDAKAIGVENFRCVTVIDALKMIDSKSFGLEKNNFADALHAAWNGRKNGFRLPLRVPSVHRIMAPRLIARLGGAVMVLSALGLLYFSFSSISDYSETQATIELKQNQKGMLAREYTDASKIFDALPVKPDVVKGALGVKRTLEQNTAPIAPFLHQLRTALGEDIYLTSITYEHTPGPTLPLNESSSDSKKAPPKLKPAELASHGDIKVDFKFSLPNNMPLEQKVIRAEDLEKTLRQLFPGYSVRILTQFGRVTKEGGFEGKVGDGVTATTIDDVAEFEMEGPPL